MAGIPTRFLQLRTLWPFPEDDVRDFVENAKHIFVVENNMTGQVDRLIRYVTGPLPHMHRVLKYNGRPFRPIEIIEAVQGVVGSRASSGNGHTTVVGRALAHANVVPERTSD